MKVSGKAGLMIILKVTKKTELHPLFDTEQPSLLRVKNDMRRLDVRTHVTKELQEITLPI